MATALAVKLVVKHHGIVVASVVKYLIENGPKTLKELAGVVRNSCNILILI